MATDDRDIYRERLGDPSAWAGDWRRSGRYLAKETHVVVQKRLAANRQLLIGMAIRGQTSGFIAAVLGVSREAIDTRRRPLGLALRRGVAARA